MSTPPLEILPRNLDEPEITQEQRESSYGRIYVYQPSYGHSSSESVKQFWTASGSKYNRKILYSFGGSLLANTFNRALSHALNLRDRCPEGEIPVTHFAILHDDVVPADNWLDTLMDEMLRTNAVLMSAVIPIKDYMGLTSTAIEGQDKFQVLRRITMTEVFDLPETFTSEDCGYPANTLLVNTGCMVLDLRPFASFSTSVEGKPYRSGSPIYFTIDDRLYEDVDRETGKPGWRAEVAPEDWNLSRQLNSYGFKVAATRKVAIQHEGKLGFSNVEPWGDPYDKVLAHQFGAKPICSEKHRNEYSNVDVQGWLTNREGIFLANLARGKRVLEIGSFKGLSTIWIARTADKVVSVDTHQMAPVEELCRNLLRYGVYSKVSTCHGTAEDCLKEFEGRMQFDLVFIDGDHSQEAVTKDIVESLKVLAPEGIIAFHDVSASDPGVGLAIKQAVEAKQIRVERADGTAIGRSDSILLAMKY